MSLLTIGKAAYAATKTIGKDNTKKIVISVIVFMFLFLLLVFLAVITSVNVVLSSMINISDGFSSGAPTNIVMAEGKVPKELLPVFVSAQNNYNVSWAVLAAVCKKDTDFGKDEGDPIMKVSPKLWEQYKVDGNGDGDYDQSNPYDAIYTTASILKAKGYDKDPSKALYGYNNSWYYVNKVLEISTSYAPNMLPTGNGMWPVPGALEITSHFGYRIDPFNYERKYHDGLDISAPLGTPVVAATDGKVATAGHNGGYGLCVTVINNNCMTLYAHLSEISVNTGDTIKEGQVIGAVGSTGRSTGPHLHFGVYVNGSPANPEEWLQIPNNNY